MYIYYVLAFFVILLLYSILCKKWVISTYLISVYLLTLLVALAITSFFKFYTESKTGSIVFSTALLLFFLPYLKRAPIIKRERNSTVIYRAAKTGYIISCFLILLSLLIFPAILQSLKAGAEEIRTGYYSYHGNIITSTAIHFIDIFSPLSYSLLTLAFYLYSFVDHFENEKKIIFVASLTAPYYGILVGGRTQMIYWMLSLFFNILLFYKYISKKRKKQLVKYISIITLFILIYVVRSTIDRFSNTRLGTNDSILLYMGQPYLNFCYFFEDFRGMPGITLSRVFPLISSFINGVFDLEAYRDAVYMVSGMDIGIFYTLLGDLYVDLGLTGMYIYAIIYFIITFLITNKKQLDLGNVLILGILFLIPLQGVFYYSFWKRQVTFCALLVFFFTLFLKSKSKR